MLYFFNYKITFKFSFCTVFHLNALLHHSILTLCILTVSDVFTNKNATSPSNLIRLHITGNQAEFTQNENVVREKCSLEEVEGDNSEFAN